MKMERNEHDCPIHDTNRYHELRAAWSSYGWRLGEPIRDAIENGGDVLAAIKEAKTNLDKLEIIANFWE
jgi:hypothetical protein